MARVLSVVVVAAGALVSSCLAVPPRQPALAGLFSSLSGPQTGCVWSSLQAGRRDRFGRAGFDKASGEDGPELFDIGSVSKSLMASVILDLEAQGLLALEDPVGEHLDGLPEWGSLVTLRDLLAMRSGIREFRTDAASSGGWQQDHLYGTQLTIDQPVSAEEILSAIAAMEQLESVPGTRYAYSNSNYMLLRAVAENAAGQPVGELMRQTAQVWSGAQAVIAGFSEGRRLRPSRVKGHDLGEDGAPFAFESHWDVLGASGVWMRVDDLALWGAGLLRSPSRLDQMAARETPRPAGGYSDTFYGLGLMRLQTEDAVIFYHLGGTEGFSSGLFLYPERSAVMAFSCNMSPDLLFARARSGPSKGAFEAPGGLAFLHAWLAEGAGRQEALQP